MAANEVTNCFSLQIKFHNLRRIPDAERWVCSEAAKLGTFYRRVIGCDVVIERPRHRQRGNPYQVCIRLIVPGREIVVEHAPTLTAQARQLGEAVMRKHLEARNEYKDLHSAIQAAFKVAVRRLQDYARRQRGNVKHHELSLALATTAIAEQ